MVIQNFYGSCERKRLLEGPRCRWEENIEKDVGKTEWKGAD
jgi:hypothetical protein